MTRSARQRRESDAARTKIRRYGVANRLNRLGTLTYAGQGCHDPGQLRQDVAAFFKGLRPGLGGQSLPYVWVPEWHPGDTVCTCISPSADMCARP